MRRASRCFRNRDLQTGLRAAACALHLSSAGDAAPRHEALGLPWGLFGGSRGSGERGQSGRLVGTGRGVRRAEASAASRVGPQPSDAWSCGSREGHEAQRSLRSGLSSRAFLRKCPDALRPGAARRELAPPGTLAAPLGSHSLARSPPSCSGFTARGATSPSPFPTALHPHHAAVGPSGAQRGQRVSLAVADQWHAARRGGRVPVAPGPPLPLAARVTRPRPASSLSSHRHRRVPCAPGAAGGARGARGAAALGRGRGSRGAASSLGGVLAAGPGPRAARVPTPPASAPRPSRLSSVVSFSLQGRTSQLRLTFSAT